MVNNPFLKRIATWSLLFIIAVAVLASCQKKKTKIPFNPEFASYISAYTSGTISVASNIRIRLTDAFAGDVNTKEPVKEKLLSFRPNIDGDLYWIDNQTLEFRPKQWLPRGEVYEATLHLNKLTKVPAEMNNFRFAFAVLRQHAQVAVETIRPYNNDSLRWMQLTGKVTLLDVDDVKAVQRILTATESGRPLAVSWSTDSDPHVHYFTIDSIARTDKDEKLILRWDLESLNSEVKGQFEQEIPSLSNFKVMYYQIVQQPEQYVQLLFSDPLQPNQSLKGLIDIPSTYNERFVIESNEVRIYPSYRLSGHHVLRIHPGVKNILGYSSTNEETVDLQFEELRPQVKMDDLQRVILPSTDGLVLPFQAVNLSAVDVKVMRIYESNVPQFLQMNDLGGSSEMRRVGRVIKQTKVNLNEDGKTDLAVWNTFYLNLDDIIKTEPGAVYRVQLSFRKEYSLYHCEGHDDDDNLQDFMFDNNTDASDDVPFNYYYDDYYYDYYYEDYDYRQIDNPCHQTYYTSRAPVGKNILASDIGLIAKQGTDNSMLFAATDLRTTKPLSGVELEVLNYQQQVIAKVKTDANGFGQIDKVDGVPFLVVAKHGKQRGYLKVANNQALNLATFDITGQQSQKGLKGMLYGERGVWRPGDTLFLSFILEDEKKTLPEVHPVTFELINPRGQVVQKLVRSKGENGFYNFTCSTAQDAPTGNYQATVRVGGAVFSKMLKVETVKPNRLKLQLDLGDEGKALSGDIKGKLNAKWLHGATARNLKANISATFANTSTGFDKFKEYTFRDPLRSFSPEEHVVFDGTVDNDGNARFSMSPELNAMAPGMLQASFSVKVFEEGGDFSVDRFTAPYAPYETFVGIKPPQPQGEYAYALETDKKQTVQVATVDANGKPKAVQNLQWKVYKIEWRWWWERNSNSLSNYVGSESTVPMAEGVMNTDNNGKGQFQFQVNYPDWGNYLIRIEDVNGGHATGETVYIDWPASVSREGRQNPEGATMLSFSLNKAKYILGEECTVTFPSNEDGRALISIENSAGVIEANWVETRKGETNYSFKTNERMTPNAYVHITLIQPHNQTANDLPIRLYGVMPLFVENPNSHLIPVISMANELEPEKSFEVKVSEKDGKAMTYTLAIVDEGLLDLTRFKTPDPWNHFYAREALGVNTFDLYDQVIGAFGSKLEKLLSLGGSDEVNQKGKNTANRFNPVVMYVGPFTVEKGKTATHQFKMPNYVGSVRVMVVAGKDMAYGSAEKTLAVKKPLMVLASLPRVVGPAEEIQLPVTVFAMDKNIQEVTVKVEGNNYFQFLEGTYKTVKFTEPGDDVVNFPVRVADRAGVGKIKVTLSGGGHTAKYETQIEVRNPNPYVTQVLDAVVDGGKSWNITFDLVGMSGTNTASLEITSMPPIDFGKRLQYLMAYPHGCLEQTTSAVFPQLYLSDVMELSDAEKAKTDANIKAGINRLASFQVRSGGMTYWPGSHYEDDWATSYAGHFMLEAKKKGYTLPSGWEQAWLSYQKHAAQRWIPQDQRADRYRSGEYDLIQAYRLYTLALAGKAEMGAMNRLKERRELSVAAKWRLAAAYALAGQEETAKSIISNLSTTIAPYNSTGYSYGSETRDEAMIIETLTLIKEREKAATLVKSLAQRLSSDTWYSTQTTAYGLLAISQFAMGEKGANISFSYALNGKNYSRSVSKPILKETLELSQLKGNKVEVKNNGNQVLFVRVINTGQPSAGSEQAASNNLAITVRYTDMMGNPINVSRIEQGMDFLAEVTVRHPGVRGGYEDLALTQIFPSGWEIINQRMDASAAVMNASQPDYQDVRDDRVYSYFDLQRNASKTFRIKLNASYLGKFYLPATSIEAMYDHTINARTEGQWVEVVAAGKAVAMK